MPNIIDAYAHTGVPRFGSADQGHRFLSAAGISKLVLVLGPQVPDLAQITLAHQALGADVRTFGIPFGRDGTQVGEIVRLQIQAGVLGLRMEPREVLAFPEALRVLGESSRWVYATNPSSSQPVCRALHEWLETYPEAFVGAPHFLSTRVPPKRSPERRALERLAAHPRFFAILSRHGGMGSTQPYPHEDLRDWVRFVLDVCGMDRVLWGSEFPVFLWRNERIGECVDWLHSLLPGLTAEEIGAFLGGNAERIIFAPPPPPRGRLTVPRWVEEQFDRTRTVPLFPRGQALPMTIYRRYLDRYLERVASEPRLTFEDFFVEVLREATDRTH